MPHLPATLPGRLRFAAALVLTGGLAGAVIVYLRAGETPDAELLEEFENSKAYRHDLELYGGKLNLLLNDLARWFDGLWHGRSLAATLVVLTCAAAGLLLLAARLIEDDERPDEDAPGD